MKRFLLFAFKVTGAHVVTYFIIGAIAYQTLTKAYYVGPHPVFAGFMRTEAEPALWGHVMRWFFPAQCLRGLLIAAAFYPFFDVLQKWPFGKRWIAIASLYLLIGFWASSVAAPGTIEGLVYLRPEFTGDVHLKVQPEIIIQSLMLAAVIAWSIHKPALREALA